LLRLSNQKALNRDLDLIKKHTSLGAYFGSESFDLAYDINRKDEPERLISEVEQYRNRVQKIRSELDELEKKYHKKK
jgi:hypothetical protein